MVDKVGDLPQVGGDQVRGEQGEHLLLWSSLIFQDGQVWAGGNQQLERGEAVHLGMINFLDLDMVKEKDKGTGESEWPRWIVSMLAISLASIAMHWFVGYYDSGYLDPFNNSRIVGYLKKPPEVGSVCCKVNLFNLLHGNRLQYILMENQDMDEDFQQYVVVVYLSWSFTQEIDQARLKRCA